MPPASPDADSSVTHVCTSSNVTFDTGTAPHRGKTCRLRIEAFRARVDADQPGCPSSHDAATTATVARPAAGEIAGWKSEWDKLKAALDRNAGIQDILDAASRSEDVGPMGLKWAKDVQDRLKSAARGLGTKALLTGEVTTPPTVEIADLPDVAA